MYADYFGLDEPPFSITPDPRYLFLGRRHADALAHLLYGIREGGGFVLLTGEVGTGKTTLTRCLLDEMPPEVDVALLLNPRLDVTEFLEAICQELGLPLPEGGGNRRLVDTLNRYLLDAHARGRRTVLIVDEAQNLSAEVLEQVRLLTNLETATTKLLQILLIGQPELRDLLARPELRQLAQRITARYHLEPLARDELPAYIAHRLGVAGARAPLFEGAALRAVWRYTEGIPRRINILCDRALLGAFSKGAREVSSNMVRHAAREILPPVRKSRPWLLPAAMLVLATLGVMHVLMPSTTNEVAAVAETPGEEAPTLTEWLDQNATAAGTDTALQALFAEWAASYETGSGTACEQALTVGLRCHLGRATWRGLQEFNRPAVIELVDDAGERYQVVLRAIDADGNAVVRAGEIEHRVRPAELTTAWNGEFLALWRLPDNLEPPLLPGSRGPGVAWLRDQLDLLLGNLESSVTSLDRYDVALADSVREFQARERLQVDGIAGEQTLQRLLALLPQEGPALIQETR